MNSKSNNIEFIPYDNANEVVDGLFKSLFSRYQSSLETSTTGNYFIFDSVQLMYHKNHKINFKCGRSYIDSPDWIKANIDPKNVDEMFNM